MVTNMGLLPGMCSRVDRQSTSLDEALVAVLDHAMVRPFIGMYPVMPAEVGLAVERLSFK